MFKIIPMKVKLIALLAATAGLMSFTYMMHSHVLKADEAHVSFEFPAENFTGSIGGLDVHFDFDPANLEASSISGTVGVGTIDTGVGGRDKHLQAGKFFDAKNHPVLSFASKSITKSNAGYRMVGDLTMKETTKEITWNFTFQENVFVAKTSLSASDYNVYGNDAEASKVNITVTAPVK